MNCLLRHLCKDTSSGHLLRRWNLCGAARSLRYKERDQSRTSQVEGHLFISYTSGFGVSPTHCPFSDPSVIRLFGYTQWYHVSFPNLELRTSSWNEIVDLRLVHFVSWVLLISSLSVESFFFNQLLMPCVTEMAKGALTANRVTEAACWSANYWYRLYIFSWAQF